MDSVFVTLVRFRSLLTAQYYQSLLQANGISAFLSDEYTAGLCSPNFWFISLEKQLRLLVPRTERQQALNVLQEAVDYASATASHPIENDEVFPEEASIETEIDMSGARFLRKWVVLVLVLIIFYRVVQAIWKMAA